MSGNNTSSGGLGLATIVFIVFLILKLTNNIDWSWWWVFSPFWIPVVIVFSIIGITIFLSLLYIGFTGKNLDNFFKKK